MKEVLDFRTFSAKNPCSGCQASYCCWYLVLEKVRPREFRDFDGLKYYLNFQDIEVLVEPGGRWGLYLRRSCRHLAPGDHRCTIRGQPGHPNVCSAYNPYTCFYKSALSGADSGDQHVRLDRARFERVVEHVRFTEFGRAVYVPNSREVALLAEEDDEVLAKTSVEAQPTVGSVQVDCADTAQRTPLTTLPAPCADCTAVCCRNLVFWRQPPTAFADIDFIRYALGFPGVSYHISAERHALVVATTCRHLSELDRRCLAYGSAERPRRCEYLNEWRCTLRREFHVTPSAAVRIESLPQWGSVEKHIAYDRQWRVARFPKMPELHALVGAERPT